MSSDAISSRSSPDGFSSGTYAPENFPNAVVYSLAYNGAYLAAEAVITLIIISLPPVSKALQTVKRQATE